MSFPNLAPVSIDVYNIFNAVGFFLIIYQPFEFFLK
jgi:hypothetical protein